MPSLCQTANGSSSFLVDNLNRRPHAYFYLGAGHVQSHIDILLSVLEQLCMFTGKLPYCLQIPFQGSFDSSRFKSLLFLAIEQLSEFLVDAVVLFDAWDVENMQLPTVFDEIVDQIRATSWKLYVSGRGKRSIKPSDLCISIKEDVIRHDLDSFARETIKRRHNAPASKILSQNPDMENRVVEKLLDIANGSFFHVETQLDLILQQPSVFEITNVLEGLSQSSTVAKELEALTRQERKLRKLAQTSLFWLSQTSNEPLAIDALREGLALASLMEEGPVTILPPLDRWPAQAALEECWKELAIVDAATHTVTLVQDEMKETLLQMGKSKGIIPLGKVCVQYLLLAEFGDVNYDTPEAMSSACEKYKLLPYAAQFWASLVLTHPTQQSERLVELLFENRPRLLFSIAVSDWCQSPLWTTSTWRAALERFQHNSNLHIAARVGLPSIVYMMIKEAGDAKAEPRVDLDGPTPLHTAVICGHAEVVKILIDNGASALATDTYKKTPLQYAFEQDRGEIFDLLYSSLCKIWICGPRIENTDPFLDVTKEQRSIFDKYFDDRHGLNHSRDYVEDLCRAVRDGNSVIISPLLCRNTDINASDEKGGSVLHYAIEKGSVELAQLLLDLGADPSLLTKNAARESPLHLAAKNGNLLLAKILLNYSAEVNIRDAQNQTAIFSALEYYLRANKAARPSSENATVEIGRDERDKAERADIERTTLELARTLLRNGLDVEIPTIDGRRILHDAAAKGPSSFVSLILHNTSAIDVRDQAGNTPYDYALRRKHQKVIRLIAHRLRVASQLTPPSSIDLLDSESPEFSCSGSISGLTESPVTEGLRLDGTM
jgi:ankyrin repeat protein